MYTAYFGCAIVLKGYETVRKDRNRHGGGVIFYIRNSINYKIRNDLDFDNLESITVEVIKLKTKPFLVNTSYRPPN